MKQVKQRTLLIYILLLLFLAGLVLYSVRYAVLSGRWASFSGNAGAFDGKLADFATLYIVSVFVHNACLPAKSRLAYCADFVLVFHSQMNTAGAYGLGESVVGVVAVVGEVFFPPFNKARRHGLCAYVHKPPLTQIVVVKVYVATLYCV